MGKTLGQVAYEAYWKQYPNTWESQGDYQKAFYESIAAAVIAAHESRRWRPISEAHEDHGECVFINIKDPGCPVCASTLDIEWYENSVYYEWTHFAPIVLTNETAERLLTTLPAPPKEGE